LASVNAKDLGPVSENAAYYRDQMVPEVPAADRQRILADISDLERPEDETDK
jgi:hypothetical protein